MTARWVQVRANVAATVDALTPETDANYAYHDAQSDDVLDGTSARRSHWQDPPAVGEIVAQGSTTVRLRYEWSLNLILSRGVASIPDFVAACATEPLNIMRAILVMTPTEGADAVLVPNYKTTAIGDADTVQIQFSLICEVDEVL